MKSWAFLDDMQVPAVVAEFPSRGILHANPAACSLFSLSPGEMTALSLDELPSPRGKDCLCVFPASAEGDGAGEFLRSGQMKAQAEENEERFRTLFTFFPDCLILHNLSGRIREVNGTACRELGYARAELLKMPLSSLLLSPSEEQLHQQAMAPQASFPSFSREGLFRRKDGTSMPAAMEAALLSKGREPLVLLAFRNMTEQKNAQETFSKISFKDPLTNLYNRAFFDEERERLDNDRHLPISVIVGDLDGLRLANETFGRSVGDSLLRAAARVLRKMCRSSDILARWGDDEFILLLPHTREDDAATIVGRIENAFRNVQVKDMPVQPSMTLGYAAKVHRWQNFQNVLREAEEDMLQKKRSESRKIRENILFSLEKDLRETSPETEEHLLGVRDNALLLGEALGLPESERECLALAARLHDIGKATLPPYLFSKEGPLLENEWEDIRKHPEIGSRISGAAYPDMRGLPEAILHHHERWDGKGYPGGAEGEEIPLLSRILAIADAYDVMTRGTPYKDAVPAKDALDEILREGGFQFDPSLSSLFVKRVTGGSGHPAF